MCVVRVHVLKEMYKYELCDAESDACTCMYILGELKIESAQYVRHT